MSENLPRLIGISGSLRRESYNSAVLKALADRVADRATLVLHPLTDVPLYNQDEDGDTPPAGVTALRDAVRQAEGLVIATPEYNYGVSGVLKNALDWLSRPHGKSVLTTKPVTTLTTSPAFTGGARAHAQLNEALTATGALLVLRPQAVIPAVHQKMTDGKFTDESTLGFLDQAVSDLLRNIRVREEIVRQAL